MDGAVVTLGEKDTVRFWSRVSKSDACWAWTGPTNGKYGTTQRGGIKQYAHRVSFELHKNRIPDGLVIDHLCRNKLCVNPSHLEAVTSRTNLMRGNSLPSLNDKKTACDHGHALDAQNTYWWKGQRFCRSCRREVLRAHRARKGVTNLTFDQAKELIDKVYDALIFADPRSATEENWNDALDNYRSELIREFRFGL